MAAYPFRAHPGFWKYIAHAPALLKRYKKRFDRCGGCILPCGSCSLRNAHMIYNVTRIASGRTVHLQNQGCAQPGGHPSSDLNALADTETGGDR